MEVDTTTSQHLRRLVRDHPLSGLPPGEAIWTPDDIAADTDNDWDDPAVVGAHAYAGCTYDYFWGRHGWDGVDGSNMRSILMVNADVANAASWYPPFGPEGTGAFLFGHETGERSTWLDIVGYELMHFAASDAGGALVAVDVVTDGGDGRTGPLAGGEQGEGLRRGAGGPVRVRDAMPAPWRTQVLADELAGARVEQPDVGVVPLHVDAAADPAGRRTVVGRRDLDAAVQMQVAAAVLVVAKRLERQRAERRAFLGEHGGDLAFGRAVDAGIGRIGPSLLPAVQIRLAVVEVLEAEAAQRLSETPGGGVSAELQFPTAPAVAAEVH